MAPRTSFLSRQPDVIASFSFGACTVQTCFQQSPDFLKESVHYDRFWLVLHGGAREIGSRENFLQDFEPLPRLGVW